MTKYILKKEIMLMFAIKLVILYGLWLFCFSHPTDKSLSATEVASHVFSSIHPGESL